MPALRSAGLPWLFAACALLPGSGRAQSAIQDRPPGLADLRSHAKGSTLAIPSLKFLSPKLPKGDDTLTVTVLGEHFFWTGKKPPVAAPATMSRCGKCSS